MKPPIPFLLLLSAAAHAAEPSTNAAVQQASDSFWQARRAGDRAALDQLLATDFLFVRASGRVGDRREFIEGFTGSGSQLSPPELTDRVFVRVSAEVAITGAEVSLSGQEGGRPFRQHFRSSDTWVWRNGHWQVIFEQITPLPR